MHRALRAGLIAADVTTGDVQRPVSALRTCLAIAAFIS
jgi:hypothetical protein